MDYSITDKSRSRPALKHFSVDELKSIGMQCSHRLPPASAVQGMFLYEMQRQTELERLFQGAMFRLARDQDQVSGFTEQLSDIDGTLKELKRKVEQNDLASKLQAGKVRFDEFQVKLADCSATMDDFGKRVKSLEEHLKLEDKKKAAADVDQTASMKEKEAVDEAAYADTALWCDVDELNSDIDLLFAERDAMAQLLDDLDDRERENRKKQDVFNNQIADRLNKLEDFYKRSSFNSDNAEPLMPPQLSDSLPKPENISPTLPSAALLGAFRDNDMPVKEFVPGKPEEATG